MKYILSFLTLIFPIISFAQTGTGNTADSTGTGNNLQPLLSQKCDEIYSIDGPQKGKVNTPYEYKIIDAEKVSTSSGISFRLLQGKETIESKSNVKKYVWPFSKAGEYTLIADISDNTQCTGSISMQIQIYNKVIIYFDAHKNDEGYGSNFEDQFKTNNILFQYFPITEKINIEDLQKYWKNMEESDIIIFGYGDILNIFSQIEALQKIKKVDFSHKRIYILSKYSHSFLSKVLALSLAKIGTKQVSLINDDQFSSLINQWSFRKNLEFSNGKMLSYEKKGGFFTLSSFLEFLAYGGISYQFLGILLVLTCIALVFNIFKQVIGLYVFGIYYPILFALILTHISSKLAVLFFIIAFIASFFVLFISRWIHLLFNAKRALLISIYILLIFLALGLDNFFETKIFTYDAFGNILIIIPLFATLFIAEKVFQDGGKVLTRGWFFMIFQFILISGIAYFLLSYQVLQYFLISYPDIIFGIILLNILVGRYLGLQVFEYVRFRPILGSLNDEEE
ncbi:hypothetical protein CSB09_03470 [Candidatus Gracilibacteria bacterium]|nr:MAG: hypothetical protein CSB09_03470 [Candidatus Gracilibacteria bacterium]